VTFPRIAPLASKEKKVMPYIAPRQRNFQGRRRGAALVSGGWRLAETAAALDAWCAEINPGLRIIALALALALLAPNIVAQSPPSWVLSFESLTDAAPPASPQWP
jgi:hypothetical protein